MSRDDLDVRLGGLLRDAVSGVEPDDRLGELRARTSTPGWRRLPLLALGGAVLAGAAVVTAVAVGGTGFLTPDEPPAAGSSASQDPSEGRTGDPDDPASAGEPASPAVATRAVAAYYLGDTPQGVRLYREFRSTSAPDDGPAASIEALTATPADPDYRTLWPDGAFGEAVVAADRITVDLADPALVERPASMSATEAELSIQQVVHTVQAYAQQRLPVEFTVEGEPAPEVLGIATTGAVEAATPTQVLSLVNLSDPEEGLVVSGTIPVEGVASSFEATVLWSLRDSSGESVDDGFFTAEGAAGDRLYPFRGPVEVAGLASGTYTLVVETADPSGGAEGAGPFTDSRTVVVE